MNKDINFGEFIAGKRIERGYTLRRLAEEMGISAPYLTDVEKDRRYPFDPDKLEALAGLLGMTTQEKATMYDLAGKKRNEVAPDLPQYIKEREYVSAALRTARDLEAGEEEWRRFVEDLKRRKG